LRTWEGEVIDELPLIIAMYRSQNTCVWTAGRRRRVQVKCSDTELSCAVEAAYSLSKQCRKQRLNLSKSLAQLILTPWCTLSLLLRLYSSLIIYFPENKHAINNKLFLQQSNIARALLYFLKQGNWWTCEGSNPLQNNLYLALSARLVKSGMAQKTGLGHAVTEYPKWGNTPA